MTLFAALLLPCMLFAKTPKSNTVSIISYNVRIGSVDDGENSWELRKSSSTAMINELKPDVIGFQEALEYQVNYLAEGSAGYGLIGKGHDRGATKCEHMSMLYNRRTTILISWGTFWLSDTPGVASVGWDGGYERSATWALLKDKKTLKNYIVVNTHLDNEGTQARKRGLEVILSGLASINPDGRYPVVVMGDFNMETSDPAMQTISKSMKDARTTASDTDSMHSFHAWGKTRGTIDFIWYSGFSQCNAFHTISEAFEGREFISDHYPVMGKFDL